MKIKKIIITSLLAIISIATFGQTECNNVISDATIAYENGHFTECIELINNCLQNIEGSENKFEAHHLLALSYMNKHEDDSMNASIVAMLKMRKDYGFYTMGEDPTSFSRIIRNYTIKPKFIFGLMGSATSNSIKLRQSYLPYTGVSSYYEPAIGYRFGLQGIYALSNKWDLKGLVYLNGSKINHHIDGIGNINQLYNEQYSFLTFQAESAFTFWTKDKWSSAIHVNFGISRMTKADMLVTNVNQENNEIEQFSADGLSGRNRLQPIMGGGLNIKRKFLTGEIEFGLSLQRNLIDNLPKENRLKNEEFTYSTLYFNDIVRLRSTAFQMVYRFPLIYRIQNTNQ